MGYGETYVMEFGGLIQFWERGDAPRCDRGWLISQRVAGAKEPFGRFWHLKDPMPMAQLGQW